MYIDSNNRLHDDQTRALTCPHCAVYSHVTLLAAPSFADLSATHPKHTGLVYRCDACNAPVFMRAHVRGHGPERIDLSTQLEEVEKPLEPFDYADLPPEVEALFSETLQCYTNGLFNAFATMCRRTLQAVFVDLGEAGKLRVFDELNDVRDMAELDLDTFAPIKRILFGTDSDPAPAFPTIDEFQAALLLEVVKDLMYECYVRRARLRQAIVVRRAAAGLEGTGDAAARESSADEDPGVAEHAHPPAVLTGVPRMP